MQAFEFGIVGGGIVGLATAARLSQFGSVIVFEQHPNVIHETSSRNSGVVHAGIYYPPTSLKTKLCIQGNRHIWNLLSAYPNRIAGRRTGKWIGAAIADEVPRLQKIASNMEQLQIPFKWLSAAEMQQGEPNVRFVAAIESPNTGIIDVASLASFFSGFVQAASNDSIVANRCRVSKLRLSHDGNVIVTCGEEASEVICKRVVCSAGLHTESLWRSGGFAFADGSSIPFDKACTTHFCKGRYVGYRDKAVVSRLVYPCPLPNLKGLGMHSVIDIDGNLRFGADATYTADMTDLRVPDDPAFIDATYEAVRQFIPSIDKGKMFVDFAGMRPKLSAEGEPARDFYIEHLCPESQQVIVLAGIESPGLTASMAIADHVSTMLLGSDVTRGKRAPWSA